MGDPDLRALPLAELLESFASDRRGPAAGSAAALAVAVAAALVRSGGLLTASKASSPDARIRLRYAPFEARASAIAAEAAGHMARALWAVQEDAVRVGRVIAAREVRDAAEGPARVVAEMAEIEALRAAAEVPVEVARLGGAVGELGRELLERGAASAKADAAAAILTACAGVEAAMAITAVNRRRLKEDPLFAASLAEVASVAERLPACRDAATAFTRTSRQD